MTGLPSRSGVRPPACVGVIGLGLVGSALATRLLASGYRVVGYDLSPDRTSNLARLGGEPRDSLRSVVGEAEVSFVAVFSSAQSLAALTGPTGIADLPPRTIIDVTTADPDESSMIARSLTEAGHGYLDAPLSGSSQQIELGEAVFLVGGAAELYDACTPLFATLARTAIHVGTYGAGARAKLATNLILGINRAALAEGLLFAERLGLDPEAFLEVVRETPAYSRAVDVKGAMLLARDFSPRSRITQHRKDLDVITSQARAAGLATPLADVHRELLVEAEAAGWGDLDTAAVLKAIEARAVGDEH